MGQYVRSGEGFFTQEADIVSFYDGYMFITEVKVSVTHHQLQTAIGQLLLQKYNYADDSKLKLQIAMPLEICKKNISKEFISFLERKIGISICLIS